MVSKIIIFNTKLSEITHVLNEYFTGPPRIVILHMDLAGHTFDDIMRSTDNLGPRYAIGFGASSTVYKCTLKSGKPAAVKKLYTHYQQNTPEFEAELDTVGRIKHRNLVSLLGYSLSPHEISSSTTTWQMGAFGMCYTVRSLNQSCRGNAGVK